MNINEIMFYIQLKHNKEDVTEQKTLDGQLAFIQINKCKGAKINGMILFYNKLKISKNTMFFYYNNLLIGEVLDKMINKFEVIEGKNNGNRR
jgi:hypothetical protein